MTFEQQSWNLREKNVNPRKFRLVNLSRHTRDWIRLFFEALVPSEHEWHIRNYRMEYGECLFLHWSIQQWLKPKKNQFRIARHQEFNNYSAHFNILDRNSRNAFVTDIADVVDCEFLASLSPAITSLIMFWFCFQPPSTSLSMSLLIFHYMHFPTMEYVCVCLVAVWAWTIYV